VQGDSGFGLQLTGQSVGRAKLRVMWNHWCVWIFALAIKNGGCCELINTCVIPFTRARVRALSLLVCVVSEIFWFSDLKPCVQQLESLDWCCFYSFIEWSSRRFAERRGWKQNKKRQIGLFGFGSNPWLSEGGSNLFKRVPHMERLLSKLNTFEYR